MLLIILLVLLICAGGFGVSPYNTYAGWGYSPVLLIVVVLIFFMLFGSRFR